MDYSTQGDRRFCLTTVASRETWWMVVIKRGVGRERGGARSDFGMATDHDE